MANRGSTEPTLNLQALCIVGTVRANPRALQRSRARSSPETFVVTLQTLAKAPHKHWG